MLPRMRKILERRFSERTPKEEPDFGAPEPVFRDMTEDEMDLWQQTSSFEALGLESSIAPYLTPMQRRIVRKEEAVLNAPWAPGDTLAEHVQKTLGRRLSDEEEEAFTELGYALVEPPGAPHMDARRPSVPQPDGEQALLIPKPTRPKLAHKPQSARGPNEVPLLHQAVRRQHQVALAQRILREIVPSATPARPSLLRSGYSMVDDGNGGVISAPVSPKSTPKSRGRPWE